ncbi:MAG TPA: class I SAM-dependent methyltransferase [Plantibacter sp.]|uniref:class I SAM-dependent methyltransferase n=1 Tax=Plantibacter sp. TaxID=1871045 RepID=UPI002C391E1F|nr:class I SAM-dependent methyltransferase [Plantibacter sp.]
MREVATTAAEAYSAGTDHQFRQEEILLGPWTSYSLVHDPKHMAFVLARYKFCAKILEGKGHVLEVGSGDGFGLPIVAQAVEKVTCLDWDTRLLEGNARRLPHLENVEYLHIDLNEASPPVRAEAAFSIDVIEHLEPDREVRFFENVVSCLTPDGILITGTPNRAAAEHASAQSQAQHINLQTPDSMKNLMERWFENVFCFGQNDEVVHTGYSPMCHYIWTVAVGKRGRS